MNDSRINVDPHYHRQMSYLVSGRHVFESWKVGQGWRLWTICWDWERGGEKTYISPTPGNREMPWLVYIMGENKKDWENWRRGMSPSDIWHLSPYSEHKSTVPGHGKHVETKCFPFIISFNHSAKWVLICRCHIPKNMCCSCWWRQSLRFGPTAHSREETNEESI